jgi:hypothetical protein
VAATARALLTLGIKTKTYNMKAILTVFAAFVVMVSILSQINFMAAKQAVMKTERTDRDICLVMEAYGFDMGGNPFKEITYLDKVAAFIKSNK